MSTGSAARAVACALLVCSSCALVTPLKGHAAFVQIAERAAAEGMGKNPISKVVDMLVELRSEMEDDRDLEQGLFDKYTCWYQTVMGAKKQSMAEAKDRVEALNSYIDDIQSGRIEFSSEGAEATADVQELNEEIEKMKQRREKEHDDFTAAKEEMETAIEGLEDAVKTMEDGTEESLLSTGRMQKVAKLAKGMLPKHDAEFLEQAVSSGFLKPDYKKLNKKNVHGQKYEMRSGKIQKLMSDMLETFKDNLKEAEDKEKDTKDSYDSLKEAKEDQLDQAENALSSLGGETASREEAAQEAKDEVGTLEDQIADDQGFAKDTKAAYEETQGKWKDRKRLMTLEITAVSNALNILQSDKARDAMSASFDDNKVFNPAATSFVQIFKNVSSSVKAKIVAKVEAKSKTGNTTTVMKNVSTPTNTSKSKKVAHITKAKTVAKTQEKAAQKTTQKATLHAAANTLKKVVKTMAGSGAEVHQKRVRALVDQLRQAAHRGDDEFGVVNDILSDVKEDLNKEAEADMKKKKKCEKLLTTKTAQSQSSSNFIDEKTRFINRTEFEIEDLYGIVNDTVGEIEETEWELNDALIERDDFHAAFVKEEASLTIAIDFIGEAKKALKKFYDDNGLNVFLQVGSRRQPDLIVEAGKAPPPPPAVSVKEYKGNEGSGGIQAILDDIKEDVKEDREKLRENEENHKKQYEDTKSELEGIVSNKMEFKGEKEDQIAAKLEEISTANQDKVSEKTVLDSNVLALQTLEPDCDYVFTTHGVRMRNRQLEAEAVNDALRQLKGDTHDVDYDEPKGALKSVA